MKESSFESEITKQLAAARAKKATPEKNPTRKRNSVLSGPTKETVRINLPPKPNSTIEELEEYIKYTKGELGKYPDNPYLQEYIKRAEEFLRLKESGPESKTQGEKEPTPEAVGSLEKKSAAELKEIIKNLKARIARNEKREGEILKQLTQVAKEAEKEKQRQEAQEKARLVAVIKPIEAREAQKKAERERMAEERESVGELEIELQVQGMKLRTLGFFDFKGKKERKKKIAELKIKIEQAKKEDEKSKQKVEEEGDKLRQESMMEVNETLNRLLEESNKRKEEN